MLLPSRPAACALPLRPEAIPPGTALPRHFVREDAAGATLCIPTAFCSYTGEALDQKTPASSFHGGHRQSRPYVCFDFFGNTTSQKRVTPSVGPEQEYFLVDREKYLQRKDLIYTGRTLFGAMPPKGQELDDHYFGVIRRADRCLT